MNLYTAPQSARLRRLHPAAQLLRVASTTMDAPHWPAGGPQSGPPETEVDA